MSVNRSVCRTRKANLKTAIIAVAVVLLMVVPVASVFSSQAEATPRVTSYSNGTEEQHITYNSNNGEGKSLEVKSSGIPATEYNPEFWEGTVSNIVNGDSGNWKGEAVAAKVAKSANNIKVEYSIGEEDGVLYLSSGDQRVALPSDSLGGSSVTVFTLPSHGITDATINASPVEYTWNGHNYTLEVMKEDPAQSKYDIIGVVSEAGTGGDIPTSYSFKVTYPTAYPLTVNKVFAGWEDSESKLVYPGDVVSPVSPANGSENYGLTVLSARWILPDLFENQDVPTRMDAVDEGKIVTELNPSKMAPYLVISNLNNSRSAYPYIADGSQLYTKSATTAETSGGMFRTIFALTNSTSGSDKGYVTVNDSAPGTFRSLSTITGEGSVAKLKMSKAYGLLGDTVIDNVTIYQTALTKRNLEGTDGLIKCNYHRAIFGTGIVGLSEDSNMTTSHKNTVNYGPGIIGGNSGGTTVALEENKKIVSALNSDLDGMTVDIATFVIIHSGLYSNIVSGAYNAQIGDKTHNLSTYLVMKGGTVMYALAGTCGNNESVNLYSTDYDTSNGADNSSIESTACEGGTFLYVTGTAKATGSYFQDKVSKWDFNDSVPYTGRRDASTIIAGTCNGKVYGSTHVFLSGECSMFDVQGGGRRSPSYVSHSYIEMSGESEVRHIVCGTITDGNNSNKDRKTVGGVDLVIGQSAVAANMVGGGYDTWAYSSYSTTYDATIDIDVIGGTVGYVYGGGFRGGIGTVAKPMTINININGGHVLHDVFGGGKGTFDKRASDATGDSFGVTETSYNANDNNGVIRPGEAKLYGDVNITMKSGTVGGNIYGGGESTPIISSYLNSSFKWTTDETSIAPVFGDVTVNVSGGTVGGSVYGAGKGIVIENGKVVCGEVDIDLSMVEKYRKNWATGGVGKLPFYGAVYMYVDGGEIFIPWTLGKGTPSRNDTVDFKTTDDNIQVKYLDYARVYGTVTVSVTGDARIEGDVYGGGMAGIVKDSDPSKYNPEVTVSIGTDTASGGTVLGNVYGGGRGSDNSLTLGKVWCNSSVTVTNGGKVVGNVYGGGAYGQVTGSVGVDVDAAVNGSVYGGGMGSTGKTNSVGTGQVGQVDHVTIGSNGVVGVIETGNVITPGSVYGGGAFGKVDSGNIGVTVSGTVTGSVYGGGEGLPTISTDPAHRADYGSAPAATSVYVDVGRVYGDVYGGGAYGIVGGTSSISVGGTVDGSVYGAGKGSPTSENTGLVNSVGEVTITGTVGTNVYGGGAYGKVGNGNSSVDVSGTVNGSVYGGGQGLSETYSSAYGYIPGNASVDVSGTVNGSVYGGGAYGIVNGTTGVTVSGVVRGNVFGGGYGFTNQISNGAATVVISSGTVGMSTDSGPDATSGHVYGGAQNGISNGNTLVTLTSGTVYGNVFGAGLGSLGYESVKGTSGVINTNATVYGNIYGGADQGYVTGAAAVTVNGGTVNGSIFGAGKGNRKAEVEEAYDSVKSTVSVTISGGTVNKVYGGSALGLVSGAATVTVSGGTVNGNVFGAGLGTGGIVSNSADSQVLITGGTFGSVNVYGGAENGIVSGNTSVSVSSVSIGGSVFGGGLGLRGVSSVTGKSSVSLTGASIGENVYGGSAYGYVDTSSVTMNSGTVGGDIYGAGLGDTYLVEETVTAYDSVQGDVSVVFLGGTVSGDLYGGSALGLVKGDIHVRISSDELAGRIVGNVFGGGKGTTGCISVNGDRYISILGTSVIDGNVYGGSANGDDQSTLFGGSSDAKIYVGAGQIGGSLFGGGFKGKTYGSTFIYIGEGSLEKAGVDDFSNMGYTQTDIFIGESIYLGGDVGVIQNSSEAFKNEMVLGNGTLYMAEKDTSDHTITFSGSIMGSGNSCLTRGITTIYLYRINDATDSEAFHRATHVILEECTLVLTGRATIDPRVNDSNYSLFMIDSINLKNGTVLTLSGAVDMVGNFNSLNSNGDPTTPTSPFNKLIVGGGNVLTLRDYDQVQGAYYYGVVSGNTIFSIKGDEAGYGAYVLGSTSSTGGFVMFKDGSYIPADRSDLDAACRCWYIAGTINNEVTLTLTGDAESHAVVNMPSLQNGSGYRYTGGTFISESATGEFALINSSTLSKEGDFFVRFGYGVDYGCIQFPDNNGTYLIDDYSMVTPVSGSIVKDSESEIIRNPHMNIAVKGVFTQALYLGYVIIYVNEVREIELPDDKVAYVVINTIQTKIHLYTSAGKAPEVRQTLTIGAVNGSGDTTLLISSGWSGCTVDVDSVIAGDNSDNNVIRFYLSAVKNQNNTLGWTDHRGEFMYFSNNSTPPQTVGTLQGGYNASLHITVKSFTGDETEEIYYITLKIREGDALRQTIVVTVKIESIPDVMVTFNMNDGATSEESTTLTYRFPYGSTIAESDCPPTEGNFVGWYTDKGCNNPFSYSTPLVKDSITVYALYMYTVTLDYMDGTTSTVLVPTNSGIIGNIEVAARPGYRFGGWYTDMKFIFPWDTETDQVQDNMTLYAKWIGWTVIMDFGYYKNNTFNQLDLGTDTSGKTDFDKIAFGSSFNSSGTFTTGSGQETMFTLDYAQYVLDQEVELVFIYWMYYTDYQDMIAHPEKYSEGGNKSAAVYTDTVLNEVSKLLTVDNNGTPTYYVDGNGNYHIQLVALMSDMAAEVHMTAVATDEHGTVVTDLSAVVNPPESFLIFPYNSAEEQHDGIYKMLIEMNGATRNGWSLQGWYIYQDNYINLLYGDVDQNYTAGTKIYLTVKQNTDYPAVVSTYPYEMIFSIGDDVKQVFGITEEDYARLTGEDPSHRMYTINFHPTWARIPYTITIGNPANGIIYATDSSGNRFTTATMYFGDQFDIKFLANDGYQFYRWSASGEGVFVNEDSEVTSFTVQGDTNISAYVIGPQILKVYIDYEGLDEDNLPDLVISDDGETVDFTFSKTIYNSAEGIVQYIGTANLGTHSLYLVGPTTDKLYDLNMSVDSTTSSNIYYVTVGKVLYGRSVPDTEHNVTFGKDGITYVILDATSHRVAAVTVTDSTATNITVPATVTYGDTVYSVVAIGRDLIAGCENPQTVTYLGSVIYRNGYVAVITNGITAGETSEIVKPGKGVSDVTEYLFQYVGNETSDVKITLEAGFYTYKDGDTVVRDKSGNEVKTSNESVEFTLFTHDSKNPKLTLAGKIVRSNYTATLIYMKGTEEIGSRDSVTMEFGDQYLAALSSKGTIVVSETTYTVYAWKLNNVTLDATMMCEGSTLDITIYGYVVASSNINMTVTVRMRNAADTGYDESETTIPVDANKVAVYRYENHVGYAVPTIECHDAEGYSVSDSVVTVTGADGTSELVVTYDWKAIQIQITDANGTRAVGAHLNEILSLDFPADTVSTHYLGWETVRLSDTVNDNTYIVTAEDIDAYYAQSEPREPSIIRCTSEVKLYEVSIITMRGTIKEGSTDRGTLWIIKVPYDTTVTTTVTTTENTLTVGSTTYTLDDTGIAGHYTFQNWNIEAAEGGRVHGAITLAAVWEISTYTLTVTGDANVQVSATYAGKAISFDGEGRAYWVDPYDVVHYDIIPYNSYVRISINFSQYYTLNTEASEYLINGQPTDKLVPAKQGSLQEYVLEFFMDENVSMNLVSLFVGNELHFTYLVEGELVNDAALTESVSNYSDVFLPILDYEYIESLDGYYFDGWYMDRECTTRLNVVRSEEAGVVTWYYKVHIDVGSETVYGRMVKTGAYNYTNVYDGTEHTVRVTATENIGVTPTLDYTYGTPEQHLDELSITYCDDELNDTAFTVTATFQKTYTDQHGATYQGAQKVFSGDFTLHLGQRKLSVIANSMIVNDASEIGDAYKSCTLIGIAANESGVNYDVVTPTYELSAGPGCTVVDRGSYYEISGRGFVNITITGHTIKDATDASADRSANYVTSTHGGQILILSNSSTVIVVR